MSRSTTVWFDVHLYGSVHHQPYLEFEPHFCRRCPHPHTTPSREQEEQRTCWVCSEPRRKNDEFCSSWCRRQFEKKMGVRRTDDDSDDESDDDSDDDSDDGKDGANVCKNEEYIVVVYETDSDTDTDDIYHAPPEGKEPCDDDDSDNESDNESDNDKVWGRLLSVGRRATSSIGGSCTTG